MAPRKENVSLQVWICRVYEKQYCPGRRFLPCSEFRFPEVNCQTIPNISIVRSFIRASENFFSFFSYKLLTNNRESALESPNNIVISAELAKKYFGKDDPVGKIITVVNSNKTEQMVVSGIFEKPVENTQIVFDMVRLIGEADSRCYVRLAKNASIEEVEKLFLENKELIPVINDGKPGPYYLESLQSAYFDTTRGSFVEASRDKTDLLIALIIGLMIIGIATFNFLGILTNKFRGKIKEYYIRRINGSSVNRLIALFMVENSIISGVSFIFSIFLIQDALPFFNELTGTNIPDIFISQSRSDNDPSRDSDNYTSYNTYLCSVSGHDQTSIYTI